VKKSASLLLIIFQATIGENFPKTAFLGENE